MTAAEALAPFTRAFTVQGPCLALAMLRGLKRYEFRGRAWSPGWYFLHSGDQPAPTSIAEVLEAEWPSAPRESTLRFSAVYGAVRLGHALPSDALRSPWVRFGKMSLPIEGAIEFAEPLAPVQGQQNSCCVAFAGLRSGLLVAAARRSVKTTVSRPQWGLGRNFESRLGHCCPTAVVSRCPPPSVGCLRALCARRSLT
ncbi:unnamed protein product [Prorocentrum cordatum]|uniref:ASCH domain-containing protein n=1 Tax=Prorocentrum cordatum TaxID=2364126 RepID=A0ABN9V089_9DINO|nr:unnamed protein product [Polarella glacialis]CAK0875912.1 unnamed protein product [Polarella glacialis]